MRGREGTHSARWLESLVENHVGAKVGSRVAGVLLVPAQTRSLLENLVNVSAELEERKS